MKGAPSCRSVKTLSGKGPSHSTVDPDEVVRWAKKQVAASG